MKRKTGVVVKIAKNYICVRTVKGEFYNLKLQGYTPKIGDIYSGPIVSSQSKSIKLILVIVFLAIVFVLGKNIYTYFTPSSSVIINLSPTIQIKLNKWDKIIDIKSQNSSGRKILESINLKNKSINNGLQMIFDKAKEINIINKKYIDRGKSITIFVSIKDSSTSYPDLSTFKKYTEARNISCNINYDGEDTLKK